MSNPLKTEDGSVTLFSEQFNEPYHSVTAGALTEAVEKFCKPAGVKERAKGKRVNLFDSCFGLGYNTFTFLQEALSQNPKVSLKVVGYEFDLKVIEASLKLDWGRLNNWKGVLRELLKNRACQMGFLTLNYYRPNLQIKIYIGEGREVLRKIAPLYKGYADIIFHDPFSPKVNPELWSLELFSLLKEIIKTDGVLTTYSASTVARKALHMAGFGVREGVSVGRKSKSTVASPAFKTPEKLLKKFAQVAPYRDLTLSEPRELIKARQEGCTRLIKTPLKPLPIYTL